VNPALAGLACVVVVGAVVAVAARETRAALLGLLVALLAAAFLADPLPSPLSIAARLVAAFLGCRLIAIAIRGEAGGTEGSRLGWPVDAVLAGAAAVIGFGTHGLGAPGGGPPEAQAAGFAVGILAAAPLVTGRDVFRLSVGAVLVVLASLLVRAGLSGTPNELEQLVTSGLIAGLGGAIGVVVMGARAAGQGLLVADVSARTIDPVTSIHLHEPREPLEQRVRGAHPVTAAPDAGRRR
jgi:hypothetical protein